jgi:hypothetical protein
MVKISNSEHQTGASPGGWESEGQTGNPPEGWESEGQISRCQVSGNESESAEI